MYIIHRRHRKDKNAYEYNDASVTVLHDDRDRVRATPKLYLPNLGKEGALHLVEEAVANAIDEVSSNLSNGTEVIVTYDETTKTISVQDDGRGFPLNKLFEMCEVLNSSAKMGHANRAYGSSGGVHGMGLKLITYMTKYMKIRTDRENQYLEVFYDDGIRSDVKRGKSKETGTYIEWQYDNRFFTNTNITCDDVLTMLRIKSYVVKGATIIFNGKTKDGREIVKEFKNNSLKDFMKMYKISTPIVHFSDKFGGEEIEVMFGFDAESDETVTAAYTNNIFNKSGGSHTDGVLEGITYFFRNYMLDEYLSEKDKKDMRIKAEDCRTGIVGIVSVYTQNPSFVGGQHKERLDITEIKNFAFRSTRKALRNLDKTKLNKIASVIKANVKARMMAENSRKKAKKDVTNAFSSDKIHSYVPVSKQTNSGFKELFIVEGLSAMGAMESVADENYQALFGIRGKIENIFDLSTQDALSSSTFLKNLYDIFGCGIGKTFDIEAFPFDRVYFATDADTDGNEIACQGAMVILKFFPEIVMSGKLYRVVPPLYEVRQDGKSVFVPTNREFLTLTQNNFAKAHKVYLQGKLLNKSEILDLLTQNERYIDTIERLGNQYAISPLLMEFLVANKDDGFDNSTVDKWNKKLSKMFRYLKATPGDGGITITGMLNSEYNIYEYVPEFLEDAKQIETEYPYYGYSVDGLSDDKNLSLYEILKIFEKYQPKIISRFKGLGEMDSEDLKRTVMKREVRHSIRLTVNDIQDAYNRMAVMHSKKPDFAKKRKDFMANFKFDIMDIDT